MKLFLSKSLHGPAKLAAVIQSSASNSLLEGALWKNLSGCSHSTSCLYLSNWGNMDVHKYSFLLIKIPVKTQSKKPPWSVLEVLCHVLKTNVSELHWDRKLLIFHEKHCALERRRLKVFVFFLLYHSWSLWAHRGPPLLYLLFLSFCSAHSVLLATLFPLSVPLRLSDPAANVPPCSLFLMIYLPFLSHCAVSTHRLEMFGSQPSDTYFVLPPLR